MNKAKAEVVLLSIVLICTILGCIGILFRFIEYENQPWADGDGRKQQQYEMLQERANQGIKAARGAAFR